MYEDLAFGGALLAVAAICVWLMRKPVSDTTAAKPRVVLPYVISDHDWRLICGLLDKEAERAERRHAGLVDTSGEWREAGFCLRLWNRLSRGPTTISTGEKFTGLTPEERNALALSVAQRVDEMLSRHAHAASH